MSRLAPFLLPALGLVVLGTWGVSESLTKRDETPGRVRVTYWEKWSGFEFDGIKSIVDDYNKSQDKVYVDLLSMSNIDQKAMMATAAGVPPDLAGLYGPNVPQYADDNAVIPLDDFVKEKGITASQYIPVYWQICNYENHTWALPSTPADTALHYNLDLLHKAGAQNAPETIEQMDALAEKMTTRKNGKIDVSGFIPAEPGWWNWAWGYYFGGKLWDGKGHITANSPENIRGFDWVASYSKKYGAGDLQTFKSGFGGFSSPQNAFMSRQVGMELQGTWMYNFIAKFQPDLKWGAAPFPYPEDRPDLKDMTIADMDVLVIPRGSKHPKEAFDFISYVQRQDVMEKLCLSHQKNSPLNAVSKEFYEKHKNPYIELFDKLARSRNAITTPRTGIWTEYQTELNSTFESISLLKQTPKEALDELNDRMQTKLDQYELRLKARKAAGK